MKISPKFLIIFIHLILIFLFVSLCLWGLWDVPLLSVNEARRAVTVREMITSQHWLLPTLNGELYLAKPPLFYWLALIPAHLIGSASELAVRLPSAVLALCCFASIFIAGSRIVGRSGSIFAAVFLGANAGFTMFARRAEIEMALTGFCLMSLLAAWPFLFRGGSRHWLILSYALLGCAFLTKGPVCLLYITLPIFVFSRWHDHARAKEFLCDPVGWIIAGVIGFSWYAAVTAQLGMDVWKNIFQRDIIGKMVGGSREPWYVYLTYLAGDFFHSG